MVAIQLIDDRIRSLEERLDELRALRAELSVPERGGPPERAAPVPKVPVPGKAPAAPRRPGATGRPPVSPETNLERCRQLAAHMDTVKSVVRLSELTGLARGTIDKVMLAFGPMATEQDQLFRRSGKAWELTDLGRERLLSGQSAATANGSR